MTKPIAVTAELIDSWADDPKGPVALVLKQRLIPVEGEDGVIFPPTYADIGYCIDTLPDGTAVALIDSVGAQANRMEPLFKQPPLSALVPQVDIKLDDGRSVSILDVGHRLGDALIRSTALKERARTAFQSFQRNGDAGPIARLAPTTLVFGAWDSRGEGAKLPRLIQSTIRAWDVKKLHRAAQYNPPADYAALDVFDEETKSKAEGNTKSPLASAGFVHVPANGPGGIVVRGDIRRDVTVNLVALRALGGEDRDALRRYILSLALIAATEQPDGFLRQGCLLTPDPDAVAIWCAVARNGVRTTVSFDDAQLLRYAQDRAKAFGVGDSIEVAFDKKLAKAAVKEATSKKGKAKGAANAEPSSADVE